ncbi:MAG TPA: hypothetical protein EYQ21_05515 [Flavobacteriales bacterium]|nr:hypothetical protein [Flavobacteriales bacterium]
MELQIPLNWSPRPYQHNLWDYLQKGGKRAVAVWHRRAGKDNTSLNWTVTAAIQRPGLYWHLLPTYQQGRKIVWDGMTKDGRTFLDYWPRQLIKGVNNTEMKIELQNNSMWQVVGSDSVDRLVGSNPVGVVLSEYSLQDPKAWDFIRPILAENGGWAVFIYTPRGRNHGYDLYKMANANRDWFAEVLDVKTTGAITQEAIEDERKAGMPEQMIQQEFYCSFDASLVGAYYATQMDALHKENRIMNVPWDPNIPVETWWDLGMHDAMSIGFVQHVGSEIRAIDYEEHIGLGINDMAAMLREKPYTYDRHLAPWDINIRELSTGVSRLESALRYGLRFQAGKQLPVQDGINAVRQMIPKMIFDANKCDRWIEALKQYTKLWDSKRNCFGTKPIHDWTSHPADMTRTGAVGLGFKKKGSILLDHVVDDYDELNFGID